MNAATIYVLCDSREPDPVKRVRYVGRTVWNIARRLHQHRYDAIRGGETHRAKWMRAVYAAGGNVTIESVATVPWSWSGAAEIDFVTKYRQQGCRLTNHTDGGEGLLNPSVSTREKMSAQRRGNTRCVGRRLSAETRAKIGAANKGRPMAAVTYEALKRWRASAFTPSYRSRQSASSRGRYVSDATKEKHGRVTWDQVREMRTRYEAGGISQSQLAREFAVTTATINHIVRYKRWVSK